MTTFQYETVIPLNIIFNVKTLPTFKRNISLHIFKVTNPFCVNISSYNYFFILQAEKAGLQ